MDSISPHGAMIGCCLLVLLGLSTTQIGMLWSRAKDLFNGIFEDEPDWS